jgi:hypothetical protein
VVCNFTIMVLATLLVIGNLDMVLPDLVLVVRNLGVMI